VYFEAAARLQSFTLASGELNVTQGAVSRQIRQLEDYLGKALFQREKRRVLLTDDGHTYLVSIAHILQQLSDATGDLMSRGESGQVTIVTSSALATFYLMPRIPAFRQRHADIPIRLMARDRIGKIRPSEYDLSLYYYRRPPVGDGVRMLFGETVFPVCSPEYRAQHRERLAGPVSGALARDLLWQESGEDWITWPEWLEAQQIHLDRFDNRLLVNHYGMVVQAAMAGQGIALGWAGLLDAELERGALVKPLGLELNTSAGFCLIASPERPPREETEVFSRWLLEDSAP
jgi:DNA-binding transcriptional LysR family regulator